MEIIEKSWRVSSKISEWNSHDPKNKRQLDSDGIAHLYRENEDHSNK